MGFLDYVFASLGVSTKDETKSVLTTTSKKSKQIDTKLLKPKAKPELKTKSNNIAIFCPSNIDDLPEIVQFLATNQQAFLNFEKIDNENIQRVLDFIGGAIFALGGKVENLGGKLFLFAPKNTKILNKG